VGEFTLTVSVRGRQHRRRRCQLAHCRSLCRCPRPPPRHAHPGSHHPDLDLPCRSKKRAVRASRATPTKSAKACWIRT